MTRPDMAYIVSNLNHFVERPSDSHCQVCRTVLRHLKGTQEQKLKFRPKDTRELIIYTDVDWASDLDDGKSTGGYCIYYEGNLISSSLKKQPLIATSSTKSEYQALANSSAELA